MMFGMSGLQLSLLHCIPQPKNWGHRRPSGAFFQKKISQQVPISPSSYTGGQFALGDYESSALTIELQAQHIYFKYFTKAKSLTIFRIVSRRHSKTPHFSEPQTELS
jgi:hypothetical protein